MGGSRFDSATVNLYSSIPIRFGIRTDQNIRPMERHSIDPNDVVQEIKHEFNNNPGLGESGIRESVVEFQNTDLHNHGYQIKNCPHCGYDRAKVTHDYNPVFPTPFEYECMNPNCGWKENEEFSDEFEDKYC